MWLYRWEIGLETDEPLKFTCMRFFVKTLILIISSSFLSAEVTDWDALRELVNDQDIKKYSAGYDELRKLVEHQVKSQTDSPELREILYNLLDDEREGGRLSDDEYMWTPRVTANLLLMKLTRYVQNPQDLLNENSLPPVDEEFQIASNEKRNARFRAWYEKKFLNSKSERKTRFPPERKLDDRLQREAPNRQNQDSDTLKEPYEKEEEEINWLFIVLGVFLVGILALLFKVWKGRSQR